MAISKKYFRDHLVLLLLSVNAFLAVAGSIFILIRLASVHSTAYIVQYRPALGLGTFKRGGSLNLLSFVVFALLILGISVTLSLRAYKINKHVAVAILSMGVLLELLTIIIANALLVLP